MNLITLMLSISTAAFAQTPTPSPGFLKDFNYQVSQLKTMSQAQALENSMNKSTRNRSICANRAHFWANDLYRFKNIQAGKVFIHFTALGQADENEEWAYHVAPYVIVNGEEIVLDPAFGAFDGKPVKMAEWEKYFGKSSNCVVLDPANNPAHLALEKNNVNADWMTPLKFSGGARQYPMTEGICYIRKTPMYYQFPVDVYGADLLRAGNKEYADFDRRSFNQEDVLDACQQAMTLGFKRDHSCYDYLGVKKKPGFFQKLIDD